MLTKTDIEKYFFAEKTGALFFICFGIVAIIASISLFYFIKTNFYKGGSIALSVLGIIFIIIGAVTYKNCDRYRLQNVYSFDMNPDALANKELPRMKKINKTFTVVKTASFILILLSTVLIFYFRHKPNQQLWHGFFIGLAIMTLIGFIFDSIASKRANIYTKKLNEFVSSKK